MPSNVLDFHPRDSRPVEPPPRDRRGPARCSGCGIGFDTHYGRIELAHALSFHLEHAPECVAVYCESGRNLVELEAGQAAIRQTLFVFREHGRWAVIGIARDGQRRIFYSDASPSAAACWLRERLDGEGAGD